MTCGVLSDFRKLGLLALCSVILNGCVSPTSGTSQWARNTVVQPATQLTTGTAGYRIGAGDRLRIRIFGEPALSGQYAVDGAGNISMPLISNISVDGQTTPEIQTAITRRLRRKYLKNPSVAVEVLTFRPFFILGEVRRAGQYPYVNGMTVHSAVAIAGGFSERAYERRVRVTRQTAQGPVRLKLKRNDSVLPGDTIYVTERFF